MLGLGSFHPPSCLLAICVSSLKCLFRSFVQSYNSKHLLPHNLCVSGVEMHLWLSVSQVCSQGVGVWCVVSAKENPVPRSFMCSGSTWLSSLWVFGLTPSVSPNLLPLIPYRLRHLCRAVLNKSIDISSIHETSEWKRKKARCMQRSSNQNIT
jgi:hypothetical protein